MLIEGNGILITSVQDWFELGAAQRWPRPLGVWPSCPGRLGGDGVEFSAAGHCEGSGPCRKNDSTLFAERTATR